MRMGSSRLTNRQKTTIFPEVPQENKSDERRQRKRNQNGSAFTARCMEIIKPNV